MEDDVITLPAKNMDSKLGILSIIMLVASVVGLFLTIYSFTLLVAWYLYRRFSWYGVIPFLCMTGILIFFGDFHKIMLLTAISSVPFMLVKFFTRGLIDPRLKRYLP